MEQRFKTPVGAETLETIILSSDKTKPEFVFIHGAGEGSKERIRTYEKELVEAGISILAFDHSGSGESTGKLNESSLAKRVDEAKTLIELLADIDDLTVCGSSMGGYTAIKMLEYFRVKNLIFFVPAIYDKDAFNLPFNEKFTEQIRRPDSWKNSDALGLLKTFKGKVLIIVGEKDAVIPAEVPELILQSAENASKREIIKIQDCPHTIHNWLAEHPQDKALVISKILEYLK